MTKEGALRLGTRGSTLALWQAEWVQAALARHGVAAELVVITTRGDADIDRPLHQLEGKGFFTKEIEEALLDGRIDVAVHSLKDLPTMLPDGLALGAVPPRADPAEALVTRMAGITSIAGLTPGAKIGTSSLRRVAQIRHLRSDLEVVPLRGNVPTRVQKVRDGRDGLDAALLAGAGLDRLGLGREVAVRLDPLEVMPAPGQGALGLEVRGDDGAVRAALQSLEDVASAGQVAAERGLLAALGGGCQVPVAAYCGGGEQGGGSGSLRLYGRVTARDGSVQITASAEIDEGDPAAAGVAVAHLLQAQGASRLLGR
ncbi:MAG TPA: hydroxymethylbilane synthase [Gemmatimonadales bacterium]|nr:hydroxymethylbilane synthase [Gemmatimonadales bacterium]